MARRLKASRSASRAASILRREGGSATMDYIYGDSTFCELFCKAHNT
jgi:hypothetical protein